MAVMRYFLYISFVAAVCVVTSCGHKISAECHQYCSLSLEQQHAQFRFYSIEKQLDVIHVCSLEVECRGDDSNPPDGTLIDLVADRGAPAIPVLVERLKTETDETKQRQLIAILRSMALKGHLKGKHEVADLVSQKASAIRGDFIERLLEDEESRKRREQWVRDLSEEIHRHAEWW